MCEICKQYLCPPSCPAYVGYSAEYGRMLYRCAECGVGIYEYDDYVINCGNPYCLECDELYGTEEDDDEETKD